MPGKHDPFCKHAVEPVVFPAFTQKLFKISDGKREALIQMVDCLFVNSFVSALVVLQSGRIRM